MLLEESWWQQFMKRVCVDLLLFYRALPVDASEYDNNNIIIIIIIMLFSKEPLRCTRYLKTRHCTLH